MIRVSLAKEDWALVTALLFAKTESLQARLSTDQPGYLARVKALSRFTHIAGSVEDQTRRVEIEPVVVPEKWWIECQAQCQAETDLLTSRT